MKTFVLGGVLLVVATTILPRFSRIAIMVAAIGALLGVIGFILVTTYKRGDKGETRG